MQPLETMMRLANKTALITGGNSGIGLATARLFVAEGARVAITGRNQATLEAAAKELGPNALAIAADATDVAAAERAVARAVEKFGKLDIVFANAGISDNTPIGGTALAAFENVIRTNRGVLHRSPCSAIPAIQPMRPARPACARWRG
jgi:NAD(P)-dependent dehydrogenase (short-subunit alcohol dehydrogenase family)